ncbi:MAG: hypothetical protein AABZ30_11385 [Myxococcota bacterium]
MSTIAPPPTATPPPSATVRFADYWTEDAVPEPEVTRFSLWETTDLVLYFYFSNVAEGARLAWLEYVTPSGGVYQTTPLGFAVGETDVSEIAVEGLWTPVQVQPTTETALGLRTDVVLPIAGTPIAAYEMTGAWTVRVYLDSTETEPIAVATVDFYVDE